MLPIVNPANGQVIQELPEDTAETIQHKYQQAVAGQKQWARTPFRERLAAIQRFRALLSERLEPLARTLTAEMGKPVAQARNEINATLGRLDFFAEHTAALLTDEVVYQGEDLREAISYDPLGVVTNISAWNYPYFVGSNVFLPALLTGNAVLYKPSEFAALTGLALAQLLHEAGVPPFAFIPVVGTGAAGAELLKHPVAGVFFTGSYGTGVKIAQAVAGHLGKLQLELGGKDPTYVCEDVDIATAAASLADGVFYNTGQSCCAVERIYVHQSILEPFLDAFLNAVRGFVLGDPLQDGTYIGPLTRSAQLDYLDGQVQDALAQGARLVAGGQRVGGPGNFYEPTVLVDVHHRMQVMRTESFGPIIGIQAVADDAEAVGLMNDTDYGLTAGVYCRDQGRAIAVLAEVEAGSVYWNCCDRVSPRLPWTGRKHSGVGSALSHHGIRAFIQPKAWHFRQPSAL